MRNQLLRVFNNELGMRDWFRGSCSALHETKLFSRASTSFGQEPNTNVNLVDCGLPGVLPTVNKNAFYKAIRFGLAVDADINQTSYLIGKTTLS